MRPDNETPVYSHRHGYCYNALDHVRKVNKSTLLYAPLTCCEQRFGEDRCRNKEMRLVFARQTQWFFDCGSKLLPISSGINNKLFWSKSLICFILTYINVIFDIRSGWEFTKLLTQIFNIFRNFGPSNLEITMSLSSFWSRYH